MTAPPDARFDVVAVGNAIVDVIARVDDAFLDEHGLRKGAMTLVDEQRSAELYTAMPAAVEISGGSAANTAVALAALVGRAAFIGRVRDDQIGTVFRHDIRAAGVTFDTPPVTGGPSTGRSLIFVTPDAHRTMQTFLGAAAELGTEAVDAALIASAQITYLEGYLWDRPPAKEAFLAAARAAHDAGRRVALTLSDPFCVERHREEFRDLVANHVDVLFANEQELLSLYELTDFDAALQRVRAHCQVVAVTRSEKGSVVVSGDEVHMIGAEPVHVVDTTGAGDAYAAGFLYGLTHALDLATSGRIASISAAEVISHVGARPETPLGQLVQARMRLHPSPLVGEGSAQGRR